MQKSLDSRIFKILLVCIIISSILTRIYQYLFHKDLWLDEAMLTFSITDTSLWDILSKPLPYTQSAPLGFLLWSKILAFMFGASEYVLYFLPFVCSLGTLYLAYKISQTFKDDFTQIFFILLVCGSLGILHYATEFKQYGIETFLGFLLLYLLFIKHLALHKFILVSVVAVLFSHTIIFLSLACIAGYAWQNKTNFKAFLRKNAMSIIALGIFFVLYYFLYLKHQAVGGFYEYWERFFLPHSLKEYPSFIKNTLLDIYLGFSPFARGAIIPLYMLLSCAGIYVLYIKQKELFVLSMCALGIYAALSFLHIYPFGHDGIIGGRLSLYMSVVFFLLCANGGGQYIRDLRHIVSLRLLL